MKYLADISIRWLFPVFLFFILAQLIMPWLLKIYPLKTDNSYKNITQRLSGPFYLIERQLKGKEKINQSLTLEYIQEKYDLPVSIMKLKDVDKYQSYLKEGNIFWGFDRRSMKLMANGEDVIVIGPFSEGRFPLEFEQDLLMGSVVKMISGNIENKGSDDKTKYLKEYSDLFGYDLSVNRLSDIENISVEDLEKLNSGKVITTFKWPGYFNKYLMEFKFLYCLSGCKEIIELGPIYTKSNIDDSEDFWVILYFSIFFMIFVLIWQLPQSKAVGVFNEVSLKASRGEINKRVDVSSLSYLKIFEKPYNEMLSRVETIVRENKEFSYQLSHELRNALTRITYALEIIQLNGGSGCKNSEGSDLLIDEAVGDSIEVFRLLDNLKSYSLLNSKSLHMDFEYLDFNRWLQEVVRKAVFPSKFKHISLNFESESNVCIKFDPEWVLRAVNNLLDNSFNHAASRVHVSILVDGDRFYMCVEDDGCGMSDEDKATVFSSFERLAGSSYQGFGLGLSVVGMVASIHGWDALVEDSPLGGVKFVLTGVVAEQ